MIIALYSPPNRTPIKESSGGNFPPLFYLNPAAANAIITTL